jgi:hypothetical protein
MQFYNSFYTLPQEGLENFMKIQSILVEVNCNLSTKPDIGLWEYEKNNWWKN